MNYTFTLEGITDEVASMLGNKKGELTEEQKSKLMNGLYRGLAILEYPTIDIELNIWDSILYGEDDDKIIPEYCVCIKGIDPYGHEEWSSDEVALWDVNVDFSAPNWRERLEIDMNAALLYHASRFGYSLDKPNYEC